jgi:hypothetical protein
VIATGVISIPLSLGGQQTLSRVMLAIAVVIRVALAALVPLRAERDRAGFLGRCPHSGGAHRLCRHGCARHSAHLARMDVAGIATLIIAFVL